MNVRILRLSLSCGVVLGAAVVGCYTGPSVDTNGPPGVSTNATDPKGASVKDKTTGIPCSVSKILVDACSDCHGSTLVGATRHLLKYEDLSASDPDDPSMSIAELALARMRSTDKPMPPDEPLDGPSVAAFAKWVKAGLPRGSCADEGPGGDDGDAGTSDGSAADAGAADASSVCTSGSSYDAKHGANDSSMAPGTACIACHVEKNATKLFAAGTVYPSLHEPDECNGATDANLSVILIGTDGVSHTVPVNKAGNFVRYTSVPLPYRALVVHGTDVREMLTPQTDGDCNGCHHEWGNGDTPGRVMAP